jgi:hypothetical protein
MSYRTYSVDEIIAYARKYSKYYQELYKDIPEDASLTDLPLIDQKNFWKKRCGCKSRLCYNLSYRYWKCT